MPSNIRNMTPIIRHIAYTNADQAYCKAFKKQNIISFPSKSLQDNKDGIQSVSLDECQLQIVEDNYEKSNNFSFGAMCRMIELYPILSAVIMTRIRLIKRFCRANTSGVSPGFQIRHENTKKYL